jgi:hypothetical protein
MRQIDEQAVLAIKVMYDRIPNCYIVAEHFGIVPSTAWKYATKENHNRRYPIYDTENQEIARRTNSNIN